MGIPFKAIGEIAKAIGRMAEKAGRLGAREVPKRTANVGSKISKSKKSGSSIGAAKVNPAVKNKPSTQKAPIEENIGGGQRTSFKADPQKSIHTVRTVQIVEDGSRIIRGSNFYIKIPPNILLTPEKSELILALSRELKTGSTKELLSQGFTISGNTISKQTSLGLLEGKIGIKIVPESPGHPTMKSTWIIEVINF